MIDEMRRENLQLLSHINEDSKSTLDYNLFVVNKFLVEESDSHWWRRLLDEPRVFTSTRPFNTDHVVSFFVKIKRSLIKLFNFK